MKPLSMNDLETCREAVGESRSREIEAKAREDAEADRFEPPETDGAKTLTYWDGVRAQMEINIYTAQWGKRAQRIERKKLAGPAKQGEV